MANLAEIPLQYKHFRRFGKDGKETDSSQGTSMLEPDSESSNKELLLFSCSEKEPRVSLSSPGVFSSSLFFPSFSLSFPFFSLLSSPPLLVQMEPLSEH